MGAGGTKFNTASYYGGGSTLSTGGFGNLSYWGGLARTALNLYAQNQQAVDQYFGGGGGTYYTMPPAGSAPGTPQGHPQPTWYVTRADDDPNLQRGNYKGMRGVFIPGVGFFGDTRPGSTEGGLPPWLGWNKLEGHLFGRAAGPNTVYDPKRDGLNMPYFKPWDQEMANIHHGYATGQVPGITGVGIQQGGAGTPITAQNVSGSSNYLGGGGAAAPGGSYFAGTAASGSMVGKGVDRAGAGKPGIAPGPSYFGGDTLQIYHVDANAGRINGPGTFYGQAGAYSFELRDGDRLWGQQPRSEWAYAPHDVQNNPNGQPYLAGPEGHRTYSFSVAMNPNVARNMRWATLFQFHQDNSLSGSPSGYGLSGIAIHGGYIDFSRPNDLNEGNPITRIPWQPGKWYNLAIDVNWSYGSNGWAQLYLDGRPQGPRYNGPTQSRSVRGQYIKQGFYRSGYQGPLGTGTVYETPVRVRNY